MDKNIDPAPAWSPFFSFQWLYAPDDLNVDDFMCMGTADAKIVLYKHRETRAYLNISNTIPFQSYRYCHAGGGYVETFPHQALRDCLGTDPPH